MAAPAHLDAEVLSASLYLVLAASLGAILITSDARLRRAAAGIVEVAEPFPAPPNARPWSAVI